MSKLTWFALLILSYCDGGAVRADTYVNEPGSDLYILSLDRFALEEYHLINYRDPYYAKYSDEGNPGTERWRSGTVVLFDVDLVKYRDYGWYFTNRVHGETTDRQYRSVGWQWETGLRWTDYLDVYLQHHSQHSLDDQGNGSYPLQNEIGARLTIYKRDR